MATLLGKDSAIELIIPPCIQMLKDISTEVRVTLMQNMKSLILVIGNEAVDTHIIPAIEKMSTDKNWRVKLAII
jgi:hypothetical protein